MLSLRRILFLAVLGLLLGYLPSRLLAATDASAWFASANPEFAIKSSSISDSEYPATYGQRGNVDCDNLAFTKRNGDTLPFLPVHSESQTAGCYISTLAGALDPNGYMNVASGVYAAELVHADNTPYKPFAFPNSDVFISNVGSAPGGIGNYIWFDHLVTSLTYQKDNYGRIRAVLTPKNPQVISDKSGNKLPVMSDNFGISDNGQWAAVDSPGKAILRINLATMEVLPFTGSYEYGNGIGATLKYAISSDGRFVAIASKNYNTFKIFDLSSCNTPPNTITTPVTGCTQRDINTFTKSKISGFTSSLQMRFLTNNLLQFYASYTSGASSLKGKYVVAAPGTDLTGMDYLAMGDSFSSGEGAFKYEIGTDEHDDKYLNLCHLSQVSYPYIIAKKIQANLFHSEACSGARTTNLIGGTGLSTNKSDSKRDNQYNPENIPPNNSLGEWIPGYKKQISFIATNNPKIITLSVGGNDIDFSNKLIACLKPGTCFPTYEDRQEVFNEIDGKLNTLKNTFVKTKNSADKEARIYIVGYPQIAYADGNCGLNVHLNHDELILAGSIITRLNTVIKTAAKQAGVNYVEIEDALNGYRLCENNDGNMAMNGLTAGNDIHGVIGNESFHPTEFGQQLMSNEILGVTNNLGTVNPPADITVKLTTIADTGPALANVPKTGRALKKIISIAGKGTVSAGSTTTVALNNLLGLTPNTTYQITRDGNSADQVVTDTLGNATAVVAIPSTDPAGSVNIDIVGTDVTGQTIDIKTVVIVQDGQNSCSAVSDSGIDFDQDGIDDACDPIIGPAPVIPEEPSNNQTLGISLNTAENVLTDEILNTPTPPVGEQAKPQDPTAQTQQIVTATGQTRPEGSGSVLLTPEAHTTYVTLQKTTNMAAAHTDHSMQNEEATIYHQSLPQLFLRQITNHPEWGLALLASLFLLLLSFKHKRSTATPQLASTYHSTVF